MLELKDIQKSFDGVQVIKCVNQKKTTTGNLFLFWARPAVEKQPVFA